MPGHDIVAVGFSAGGLQLLLRTVSAVRDDLPAALFAVHHLAPQSVTAPPVSLGRTLSRAALLLPDLAGARQALVGTQAAA